MEQEKQIQDLITASVLWAKNINLLHWKPYQRKTHSPTDVLLFFFQSLELSPGRGKHLTVLMRDFEIKSQFLSLVNVVGF